MGFSPDCLSQAKRMTQTPVDEGKASDQAAETSAVNDVPPAPVPPRASGQKSGLILSVVALVLAGGAVAFSAVNWKNLLNFHLLNFGLFQLLLR